MNRRALIVFGRNPIPGEVKTRLGAQIGARSATALYEACLIDTLERCDRLDADVRLYLCPTAHEIHDSIDPYDRLRLRQVGTGLGARMCRAIDDTLSAGYERVVLIGSDLPNLPAERITAAFDSLVSRNTVVIGPAYDGGYYLIGLTRPCAALFEGMTFTHPRVLEDTLVRCRASGHDPVLLPPWYDVDTLDDVKRLAKDLVSDAAACPHTRNVLVRLGLMENTSSEEGSASKNVYFVTPPKD